MTTFIKKQKEDCANSSLSISTITTAGNLLQTSSSNTNLTNTNNVVPKTQINLFNQSQKQSNKQQLITKNIKKSEPLKIIPKEEAITINVKAKRNNNSSNKQKMQKQKKENSGPTTKRGMSQSQKIPNKALRLTNEKNKSCSNIKTIAATSKNPKLPIEEKHRDISNTEKKKAYARSFIGIKSNNDPNKKSSSTTNSNVNSTNNSAYNTIKSTSKSKNNAKFNSLRPTSRAKLSDGNKKEKVTKHLTSTNINRKKNDRTLTLDIKNASTPTLKVLAPTIDTETEREKYKDKMEEIDTINDTNLTSLLYLISKCENILTNQFNDYIKNSFMLSDRTNEQLLSKNISQNELMSEIDSFFSSISELNAKIKLFPNPSSSQMTIKDESEQRKLIYNECFEQCFKHFKDIQLLLIALSKQQTTISSTQKNPRKVSKKVLMSKKKSKLLSKKKFKNNYSDSDNVEEDTFIGDNPVRVNVPRMNEFNVKKPKEQNLKYKPYQERSDIFESDEDDPNISGASKIVIGEIEGYKDIIEKDKVDMFKHQRSKSSFNLHNKISKRDYFKNIRILDEDNEISDLEDEFESSEEEDNFEEDNELKIIDDEYKFEDEGIKKRNKNHLIPYHISKISFCKIFDDNGNYKIKEDFENVNIPLSKKQLKKLKSKSKRVFNKQSSKGNLEIQSVGKECIVF